MGNIEYSKYYIDKLIDTNCDGVTFQIREKEFYKNNKQFENHKLSFEHYNDLRKQLPENKKLGFAIADYSLIDNCEKSGADFYKILSQDIDNYKLIDGVLETEKPIYISTGMSTLDEIDKFYKKYSQDIHYQSITLLHTQLSKDSINTNLRAISVLKKRYPFNVGFSNHSLNHKIIFTAIGFRPSDIFFYVCGSKIEKHPDQEHSVNLKIVKEFIIDIQDCFLAIGSGEKIKMENQIDLENKVK